jgi:hypothetical protein
MRLSLASIVCFGAVVACQRVDTDVEQLKPEGADCAWIAEDLASIEIGNYAPPEERARVVTAKRRLCDESSLTKPEAECLVHVRDRASGVKCAARLFPGALTQRGDCAAIVAKIRASVEAPVQNTGSDGVRAMDKMMPAMQESCEEDGWPDSMKKCIAAASNPDVKALQRCSADMPKDVQDKLAQRMLRASR